MKEQGAVSAKRNKSAVRRKTPLSGNKTTEQVGDVMHVTSSNHTYQDCLYVMVKSCPPSKFV